jgi:acyl-CoA synthetase (AMP-forming)/AMP-acid ligase II
VHTNRVVGDPYDLGTYHHLPVPAVKSKIIDPNGKVVDIGKPGEICIAGYLLQKGWVSRTSNETLI